MLAFPFSICQATLKSLEGGERLSTWLQYYDAIACLGSFTESYINCSV